jgi:UTP--glucose-1-phosphate uridylyltransferase
MSVSRKVTKVVIPVAGLGTRFLPATKALPKELLPIVDKPIIHHIVREAALAGVETIVFVTSRPKISIEDYFDPADLTAMKLEAAKKEQLIEETLNLSRQIHIVSVRQYHPRGLGHAILQAKPVVDGQCFAVILGDDIVRVPEGNATAIQQCLLGFAKKEAGSVVGVLQVPEDQVNLYGIAAFKQRLPKKGDCEEIASFIEKPAVGKAPSNWALPGRYVFEPEIISSLEMTAPGAGGEIQLTDGMQNLLKIRPFYGQALEGERFDTGSKLGYLMANVAYALEDPKHKEDLRAYLKTLLAHQ